MVISAGLVVLVQPEHIQNYLTTCDCYAWVSLVAGLTLVPGYVYLPMSIWLCLSDYVYLVMSICLCLIAEPAPLT